MAVGAKPKPTKIQDEEHVLDRRRGIKIRVEVWAGPDGKVTRFNLAYINPSEFAGDNGRVLGYDNAHGTTHRHLRGKVKYFGEMSYEQAVVAFDEEVQDLRKEIE